MIENGLLCYIFTVIRTLRTINMYRVTAEAAGFELTLQFSKQSVAPLAIDITQSLFFQSIIGSRVYTVDLKIPKSTNTEKVPEESLCLRLCLVEVLYRKGH